MASRYLEIIHAVIDNNPRIQDLCISATQESLALALDQAHAAYNPEVTQQVALAIVKNCSAHQTADLMVKLVKLTMI